MAKKRRSPEAPPEGATFDSSSDGKLVIRGGLDGVLAALPTGSVRDINLDQVAGTAEMSLHFELCPPSRELDPAFDPWTATPADALARGMDSPEASAWAFARATLANREAIETDGRQLLEAVATVMDWGLRSPEWLAKAFRQRLEIFQTYETSSLDRAFGVPPRNERTLATLRDGRHFRGKVHEALLNRLRVDPDRPIDNELWEEVGQQFEMGRDKVIRLYKLAVSEDGATELVAFKRMLKVANMNSGETDNSPVIQKRR